MGTWNGGALLRRLTWPRGSTYDSVAGVLFLGFFQQAEIVNSSWSVAKNDIVVAGEKALKGQFDIFIQTIVNVVYCHPCVYKNPSLERKITEILAHLKAKIWLCIDI